MNDILFPALAGLIAVLVASVVALWGPSFLPPETWAFYIEHVAVGVVGLVIAVATYYVRL